MSFYFLINCLLFSVISEKVNLYNMIIIDESGSMSSYVDRTVDEIQKKLSEEKASANKHQSEQNHYMSLVQFSTGPLRYILDKVPTTNDIQYSRNQFNPNGGTALYDAIGDSVTALLDSTKINQRNIYMVTIITDGEENSSARWNEASVKELLSRLNHVGWIYVYMGTNQNANEVGQTMGINNTYTFVPTEEGFSDAYEKDRLAKQAFYEKVSQMVKLEEKTGHSNDNFTERVHLYTELYDKVFEAVVNGTDPSTVKVPTQFYLELLPEPVIIAGAVVGVILLCLLLCKIEKTNPLVTLVIFLAGVAFGSFFDIRERILSEL